MSLWEKTIERCNIQKIYHNCGLDNCKKIPSPLVIAAKKWVKSSYKKSILISGCTGSGKTHFCTSILKECVESGIANAIYVRSRDLDKELLTAFEEKRETNVLAKYSEADILFWDDLASERNSDRIREQFYDIIDARVGNLLTTVCTTNLSMDLLAKHYGERISSRLQTFTYIVMPKIDIRNSD